ncbi:MAG: HAD-IIIC family phosphatase [Planctomycetaceae bacterium]|nr:HAD-IIIC family phosphatase [Planctomycetaceae bacterium]
MFQLSWKDQRAFRTTHGGETPIPLPPPDRAVQRAATLFWEEHCVECSAPQCYSQCSLYVARRDGRCARFAYGIQPNPQAAGLLPYGADIFFRRWAKLETAWSPTVLMANPDRIRRSLAVFHHTESAVSGLAELLHRWSPRRRLVGALTAARRWFLKRFCQERTPIQVQPDAFYIKCYSPEATSFHLQIELVTDVPIFRTAVEIQPGWNEYTLTDAALLSRAGALPGLLRISIAGDREVRVIFSWLDLVQFEPPSQPVGVQRTETEQPEISASRPAKHVKCVAWDLDNTLWHGVIGDVVDGQVVPNQQMLSLIPRLDERGILQTIVSKNNYETAWAGIERLGLRDYFLYPAIHWGPKSESLRQIAAELNINLDTFAVVDDSEFERTEIGTALPQVRVFDPADGDGFLQNPEFQVPISQESRSRRLKYLAESQRRSIQQTWRGDYDDFLRSCGMKLYVRTPRPQDVPRCVELLQRSNQFNLSGRRYDEVSFENLLDSADHDCFCLEVHDSFGGYGIVGFASFRTNTADPQLDDFVLSCRAAQKRIEATFLLWYAARSSQGDACCVDAQLVVTERNAPLRAVLQEIGFRCIREAGDRQHLRFESPHVTVPDVVQLIAEDEGAGTMERAA